MVTLREKKHIVGGSPSPSAVSMPTCNRASRQDASSKPKIVHMCVCTFKNIPLQNMFEDPCVQPCVRISHCNTMWLTLWPNSTFMTSWSNMALHHLLMFSNVSVYSTLVHHIIMMRVTLCKVLPTHHYNITHAKHFSTYRSHFWSKITKVVNRSQDKTLIALNAAYYLPIPLLVKKA